jgi:diguanylate cyclase (GGDEF)-like protein
MSLALVSALAGDHVATASDHEQIRRLRQQRGTLVFSDALYSLTRHRFSPETAATLWLEILAHERELAERLGRNVRIVVATLDYLSNITDALPTTTLVPEGYVAEIETLAMHDGLTGLFNPSTSYELLELELKSHERNAAGLSFLLLDIDDFKSINDREGHPAGDRVLVDLAAALRAEARASDLCCRLGGDEFGAILRFTDQPSDALELAERVRGRVSRILCNGHRITVSIGVASAGPTPTSSRALVEQADAELRRAKRAGGNRVAVAEAPVRPSSSASGTASPS